MKQRLYELFLVSSTEYAELLLGFLSLSTGFWLFLPSVSSVFQPYIIEHFIPQIVGIVLLMSGMLKLVGIYHENFAARKISCFLAAIVWGFLTASFLQLQVTQYNLIALPLTAVMSLFNALIFIKLKVVSK
jgi:hypothetical protein